MKEIITISLGKHSNHIATHFWNAQDENLKVIPESSENYQPTKEEELLKQNTLTAYYETEKS